VQSDRYKLVLYNDSNCRRTVRLDAQSRDVALNDGGWGMVRENSEGDALTLVAIGGMSLAATLEEDALEKLRTRKHLQHRNDLS
jgi:hypothetical protein